MREATEVGTTHLGAPGLRRADNPQVQGIIIAIPKGGSDNYGASNPQGAKGKINILSSPIFHWYDSTERLVLTRNEK